MNHLIHVVIMRAYAGIFIIFSILFLVGTVGAIDASVINPPSKDWVIANGVDQSTLTVNVQNTLGPINGATVTFTVNNSVFGTMSPVTVTTGPSGLATSTFTVNKKSGTAIITATISYNDGAPVSVIKTVPLNIDHDILTPKFTPTSGTAGETVPFIVTIKDQWGNPIDNRRGDNTVGLSVTCTLPNDCSFVGYGHSYTSQPDSQGNLTIPIQFGTKIGVTTIIMNSIKDPVKDIDEQYVFLDTLASNPMSLTAELSPAVVPPYLIPTVPVYTGIFYFRYTVLDKFGNPVENQLVKINTSFNEASSSTTNSLGRTNIQSYGPKSNVFNSINITATAANLTNIFTVAIAPSEPKDAVLSVKPQTMASLEVDPTSQADVVVRVVDNFGNPVSGQNITFSLSFTPVARWNANPHLTSYMGTSDAEGNVKTIFIPGSFNGTTNIDGSCVLSASWPAKPSYPPKTITLTWMNYPYLSIYTTVSNQTILVNDTVDVTIKVVGNGKANKFRPITVMLDQDTSSSMKNPSDTGGVTREEAASAAATVFINKMDETNTQMGLETFGWDQNDPTIGHMPIPSLFSDITHNLAILGGLGSSKQMELSLDTSLNKIIAATSSAAHHDDIKALIMLSDGGSNLDNHGTLTTLINKANANGIVVFTISYLNGKGGEESSQAFNEMEDLAIGTGGKHYSNKTSAGLKDIYLDIAKRIQILAGANTTMSVSFTNISVNNTFMAGTGVYDYIPVGPFSPLQTTVNPNGRTSIIWTNGSQTVKDQSSEWPQLQFEIGSIEIGQNWSTTFRLKVKQLGLIKVFGDGSKILFNGGSGDLILPDLFINVKTNLTSEDFKSGQLIITNLPPSLGASTDFIPVQWNTDYNATVSTNVANEIVSYRINAVGAPWNQFATMTAPSGYSSQSTSIDVRNFRRGNYIIWVHATAGDADDADAYSTLTVGSASPYFIKLQ